MGKGTGMGLAGLAARPAAGLIAASGLLLLAMLWAGRFFLFSNTALFDDSFIYLHVAANLVETGSARYFPIAGSEVLLSSSPLRLFTLVPGFLILEHLGLPLRTMEAARFAFLCGGLVAFLCFLPFWTGRPRTYLLLGAAFFLLGTALDTLFLMEGGVLFLSLLTLLRLLGERSEDHFKTGIALLLVGLSRPEMGVVAMIVVGLIHSSRPAALLRVMLGLGVGFLIYWILMRALGVHPIPGSIWTKHLTGKLRLFSDRNLIEVLPGRIARIIGLGGAWAGWVVMALPAAFALVLARGAIPVLSAIGLLLILAIFMPGNFVWYGENFMIALLALLVAVTLELHRRSKTGTALACGGLALLLFSLILITNAGRVRHYPWNENAPIHDAYRRVAGSATGDGKYLIRPYSAEPVRIRMCEIGLVSFFSGPNAWIHDLCGLAQIGNLKGAAKSGLRHFYPSSFAETGDAQLARFGDPQTTRVIEVWALPGKEEAAAAAGKCRIVADGLCINEYR